MEQTGVTTLGANALTRNTNGQSKPRISMSYASSSRKTRKEKIRAVLLEGSGDRKRLRSSFLSSSQTCRLSDGAKRQQTGGRWRHCLKSSGRLSKQRRLSPCSWYVLREKTLLLFISRQLQEKAPSDNFRYSASEVTMQRLQRGGGEGSSEKQNSTTCTQANLKENEKKPKNTTVPVARLPPTPTALCSLDP